MTAGIGRALVERFVKERATVVAVDLIPSRETDSTVDSQICDLGDSASIAALERYLGKK